MKNLSLLLLLGTLLAAFGCGRAEEVTTDTFSFNNGEQRYWLGRAQSVKSDEVRLLVIYEAEKGDSNWGISSVVSSLGSIWSRTTTVTVNLGSYEALQLKRLRGVYIVKDGIVRLYPEKLEPEKIEDLQNHLRDRKEPFALDDIVKYLDLKSTPIEYGKLIKQ